LQVGNNIFGPHSKDKLMPDSQRIEAILNYPAPRNQQQLRRFLGVCGFHQRFIINYASNVEPLLVLLRKQSKWKWSTELQSAFETLGERFAHSIHMIHPDDNLPYVVHTNASGKAIAGVLMQTTEDGETRIVSTASRVLTLAEQLYSTCEQELLAIVYALQKFRIYVFGRKITLYTDNKSLSFLQKCVLTSNRVARWVIELQQYDIQVRHITGANNYLADVLSRNPAGLTEIELRDLRQPANLVVHAITLNIDPSVTHELKDLAAHQAADQRLARITERLNKYPNQVGLKYKLLNGILYSTDQKHYPFWRPMLPSTLDNLVIKYVHTSIGHLGVDICMDQVAHSFHIKNLDSKIRKFIARCDTCQRVKYLYKAYTTQERSYLPAKPGDLCALDLFGALPLARGGVRYILVCYDVFSKHVKLYALKGATTRSCLNKLINHYFTQVIKSKCILSDNGTQFQSPLWKKSWPSTTCRFDLHQFGIRKLTPLRDACAKFPNFVKFIVAKITENGQNYSLK